MLARMSAREMTEWQAFERVDGPLGRKRDDVLATLTAFYVSQSFGAKRRFDRMVPNWDRQPQDWRHMQQFLKAVTVANGGTIAN